jgi:phenylalanine-4-hydroxylase
MKSDIELLDRALKTIQILADHANAKGVASITSVIEDLGIRIEDLKEAQHKKQAPKKQGPTKYADDHHLWDHTLTAKYEKAKELRACGVRLKDALEQADMSRDQWYRRQNIERKVLKEYKSTLK